LLAKRKVRARDLKKQRWAGIVAGVLAFVFVFSLVGYGVWGNLFGDAQGSHIDPQAELQPEDYLNYYEAEIERLEIYLAEHEATEPVLSELAENYRYLIFVRQLFFADDEKPLDEYHDRLVSLFKQLTEISPDNLQHRLELINLYMELGYDEQMIAREVSVARELLRDEPNPVAHISFIGLLSSAGELEKMNEEVEWLQDYFAEAKAEGKLDNEGLFYYAVLLGEYQGDRDAAKAMLEVIMEEEGSDSPLYQEALNYLNYLQPENENGLLLPD
jgi:hypothetical protein